MDLCKRRAAWSNQLQIVNIMVDTNRVNPCRLQLTSRLEVPDACSRFPLPSQETVAREWIDIARERIEMIFLRSPQLTARKTSDDHANAIPAA
jgi:hypothetical protein